MGRYGLLIACYVASAVGIAILVFSTSLWQFWLSAVLLSIGGVSGTVGAALVSELAPSESLSMALAQYGSTGWIGAIIGLTGTGYALKIFGTTNTFMFGVLLAGLAIVVAVVIWTIQRASARMVKKTYPERASG